MKVQFPAIRTGYAEPKESRPKVAVMDNFRGSEAEPTHGEMVESVSGAEVFALGENVPFRIDGQTLSASGT
ncbi:MAG: hypothetical protein WC423_27430, partial [Vulcanimicrobiota bacterium]